MKVVSRGAPVEHLVRALKNGEIVGLVSDQDQGDRGVFVDFFGRKASTPAGGAELAIKEITDRLDPDEFAFDMITLRFDRKLPAVEKIGNITVHRIGFAAEDAKVSDRALPLSCRLAKFLFPFTSFFKALSLHRKRPYDMVWAMMANQAGFGALFFKLFNQNIPYFLELQDGTPLERIRSRRPIAALLWPLYRAIYRKADVVKAISNFIKDLARDLQRARRNRGPRVRQAQRRTGSQVKPVGNQVPARQLRGMRQRPVAPATAARPSRRRCPSQGPHRGRAQST